MKRHHTRTARDSTSTITRREVLRGAAAAAGLSLAAPFINLGRYSLRAGGRREYSQRCIDLVTGSLVIDMLGLTTLKKQEQKRVKPIHHLLHQRLHFLITNLGMRAQ